jgi:hypothetical protein
VHAILLAEFFLRGPRCDLEFDGRAIGWAILVARNGHGDAHVRP